MSETLQELARQRRTPDRVAICPAAHDDIDLSILPTLPYPTTIVHSSRGTAHQRNAIIRAAQGFDVLIFLDDDFFPCSNYLANAEILLREKQNVVLATGQVIEDGIHGPGLTPSHARERLSATAQPRASLPVENCYGAYGCNMVIRVLPVLENKLMFDELLPLYAWQEDTDFSRRIAAYGRVVQTRSLAGVHLGAKDGRTSGVRFGYSQIANPIYLMKKGTLSVSRGFRLMARNVLANSVRSLRPEPYIDRVGRLKGNLVAFSHLLSGRLHPEAILRLD